MNEGTEKPIWKRWWFCGIVFVVANVLLLAAMHIILVNYDGRGF